MIVVDVNHQRNHDGRAFFAYKMYPDSAPLSAGASLDIALAAPSGVFPHITIDAMCLGDAELYIYEGASATGGTAFTPVNRNRNYAVSNVSQIAMIISPTVTSLGTEIDAQIIAGGAGKKSGGGVAGSLEYVLKPLTTYLFSATGFLTLLAVNQVFFSFSFSSAHHTADCHACSVTQDSLQPCAISSSVSPTNVRCGGVVRVRCFSQSA